jgi:ectoine utilization protein EutC
MHLAVPEHHGEVDVKAAFLAGADELTVKISSGYFANPARGLPSASGLMALLDAGSGIPRALILDGGYLTDLRTALAGALAAEALARPPAETAGILGAGAQARWQLRALALVLPLRRAAVWARDPARAEAFAAAMTAELGLPVTAGANRRALVEGSDVVVTTTPAREPLVEAGWLRPGQHVTAMGSDAAGKQELASEALARAEVLVVDELAQCLRHGELRHAVAAGLVDPGRATALGDVLRGAAPGRSDDAQVSVCDLTGTGVQDAAIAGLALRRATAAGIGTVIDAGA